MAGNNTLVTTQDLKDATGYVRIADVIKCLESNRIPFFKGKDGQPWTTVGLMENPHKVDEEITLI
tara:strand:+ start:239 stop:433 length:195 start_codon:yes stop_codon:yes gene_type:complete